tara:strand:+ start:1383 stop:1547 length:165 start_codon:yes stop_codon:yes gene_type:complete
MTTENSHGISQAQRDANWVAFIGKLQFKKDPLIFTSAKGNYDTDTNWSPFFLMA